MNNINHFSRISFEKLEAFDTNRSSLSAYVLIRNSLIHAWSHQNEYQCMMDDTDLLYEDIQEDVQEEQVWLESCFTQLTEEEMPVTSLYEDDDSDEDILPLSPEDTSPFYRKQSAFFINEDEEEEEDGLICYDIPFLSLDKYSPRLTDNNTEALDLSY
ncbi:hypothetical protein BDB01DRAFT_782453 [Pilobolus umbonatus]|nr:hypothetical protein BDB01DRAFT_782453 [Pilobolus umbonatus]